MRNDRRGVWYPVLRHPYRAGFTLLLVVAFLAYPYTVERGGGEVSFLAIESRFSVQRRKEQTSPGNVLVDGILTGIVAVLALGTVVDVDLRIGALLLVAWLHFRILPRARRQALEVCNGSLEELRACFNAIDRIQALALLGLASLLVIRLEWAPASSGVPLALMSVRPGTFRSFARRSAVRDGVVDHYRVRTHHTDSHWVLELRQPLTLHIPRFDPDFADIVMVLLNHGRGSDGKTYLDQATIGQIFKLSRQMTNSRVALYKSRQRIEDVLSREWHKSVLTPPIVEAIHRALLEDPFRGATAVRQRLVEMQVISGEGEIGLPTVTRAMQSVDYLTIQDRIQELLRRGEVTPNHEKICQLLFAELTVLAEKAGLKTGQKLIPVPRLIDPHSSAARPAPAERPPAASPQASPATSQAPPAAAESAERCVAVPWRKCFLMYFTFGAPYREIAWFLGVHASTVYRWLRKLHRRLPPLQQILGAVRYSGTVAADEKFILAPKPHREGKMARWAYLFIAIDPYTYDLLHAEVYPARNTEYAKAFLLGLKGQGVVDPKVFVTDLWGPYETVIPAVFPGALHHQCVFHAEQACSNLMRDKLGRDFKNVPAAKELRTTIISLFRSGSRRTLRRRYATILKRRDIVLAGCPGATLREGRFGVLRPPGLDSQNEQRGGTGLPMLHPAVQDDGGLRDTGDRTRLCRPLGVLLPAPPLLAGCPPRNPQPFAAPDRRV